jgi:CRISPR-associated protein Csd2
MTTTLSKKIDFAVILCVRNANPNGDPLNGNRPRTTYEGLGEISDVAIKRKVRNRVMELAKEIEKINEENRTDDQKKAYERLKGVEHPIFVQSDDNRTDEHTSLRERAEAYLKDVMNDRLAYQKKACETWFDVRAFGQVFPFKGKGKGKKGDKSNEGEESDGVSIGIRGPVSIHPAFSVVPVLDRVSSIQITKSVSNEPGEKRGSDTMGMKHRVDHGVYVFYGSINPQLASKTGFSDDDAAVIKEALRTLFRNDASSARPEGSMEVYRVYWWEHNSPNGQYSSAKVHRSLRVRVRDGIEDPKSIDDYVIELQDLDGLKPEIIEGE